MRKTTLLPDNLESKLARSEMLYSTFDFPISSTMGCTLKGKLTLVVERYLQGGLDSVSRPCVVSSALVTHLISSNSPSGGVKLILLSTSYLPNLTH